MLPSRDYPQPVMEEEEAVLKHHKAPQPTAPGEDPEIRLAGGSAVAGLQLDAKAAEEVWKGLQEASEGAGHQSSHNAAAAHGHKHAAAGGLSAGHSAGHSSGGRHVQLDADLDQGPHAHTNTQPHHVPAMEAATVVASVEGGQLPEAASYFPNAYPTKQLLDLVHGEDSAGQQQGKGPGGDVAPLVLPSGDADLVANVAVGN